MLFVHLHWILTLEFLEWIFLHIATWVFNIEDNELIYIYLNLNNIFLFIIYIDALLHINQFYSPDMESPDPESMEIANIILNSGFTKV